MSLKFYLIPFQYSYGHAKLFAAHNVLSRNRYNDNIYLIGDGGNRLYHVEDKCDEGASAELTEVWNAPKFDLDCDEVYNASLTFPGSRYAVYGNGRGKIYIIDIEDNWKTLIETEICGTGPDSHSRNRLIERKISTFKTFLKVEELKLNNFAVF